MSRANINSNETSSATRCKIDVTHPTSFNSNSSPIRHEPRRHGTANPIATPLPPPVVVAGQETGETKVEEEECAASRSGFGGLFPCAGRPLPGEVLECLFAWLRSSDLSALYSSSSAAAFPEAEAVLCKAIGSLVKHRYGKANPTLRDDDPAWRRDLDTLRHAELSHVSALTRGPQRPGRGYYLSKAWVGNLRRYVEAQARRRRSPSFSAALSSGGKEKRSRGRDRAESNIMPPWEDVNADLTCHHGGLARSSSGTRGKRQVVDKRVWREVAAFFPAAEAFRADDSSECPECLGDSVSLYKAEEAVKRERQQEIALPILKALYARKTGVPAASMWAPRSTAGAGAGGVPAPLACPLLPGIYHLLPRCWLNAWRTYVREAHAPRPRTLDTALLLCEGHGLLLPPPHVEEFLSGERRALLGGLDRRRSGCVCEVLTLEEWDALTLIHPCDFGVRFCIDPDNGVAIFNSKKCKHCDPCYIGELYVRSVTRKLIT